MDKKTSVMKAYRSHGAVYSQLKATVETDGVNGMAGCWEMAVGVWYNKVKIPSREVIAQIKEVTYVYDRNQSAERLLFQVFAGE